MSVYDECMGVYDEWMSVYDEWMSVYDEWMSAYNEWMSVYDEWMSVYDERMSVYDEWMSVYDECMGVYDEWMSVYDEWIQWIYPNIWMFSVYGECWVSIGVVDCKNNMFVYADYNVLLCMLIYNICISLFENKLFKLFMCLKY